MANIPKLLQQLRSPNKNSRFDACEELRVAESLPDAAILALEDITKDPDPLVADAAHRALQLHRPLPAPGAPHSSAIPSSASDTPSTPAQTDQLNLQMVNLRTTLNSLNTTITCGMLAVWAFLLLIAYLVWSKGSEIINLMNEIISLMRQMRVY